MISSPFYIVLICAFSSCQPIIGTFYPNGNIYTVGYINKNTVISLNITSNQAEVIYISLSISNASANSFSTAGLANQ